jgi:mersacidin/lichenicidin family type 2 lantibiotic
MSAGSARRKEHDMTNDEMLRAWKDRHYRRRMGSAAQAVAASPAGAVELDDERLAATAGGAWPNTYTICLTGCLCDMFTFGQCDQIRAV